MKVGSERFQFSGWTKLLQLSSIRRVLQEGLLLHLSKNELLSDIFELKLNAEPEDPATLKESRQEQIAQSKIKIRVQQEQNEKQRKNKKAHLHEEAEDEK